MNKLLVIGELNKVMENLNRSLTPSFQVQVCGLEKENIKAMLRIVKPDLIIVCLIGVYDLEHEIFESIQRERVLAPVLTIGSKQDHELYEKYYTAGQYWTMCRPIMKSALLDKCGEILGDNLESEETEETVSMPLQKVLVVDDSPLFVRNIKKMLDANYDVIVATSGKQALSFAQTKKPDIILLDYEMPGMDGKETFQQLKENEDTKMIPVVFLTGVSDKQNIISVLELEPAGYILKPPTIDKLIYEIDKALGK